MYIGENYMGVGYDERNEKISRTKIEGFGICQTVSDKLTWSHICELIKIDDAYARDYKK